MPTPAEVDRELELLRARVALERQAIVELLEFEATLAAAAGKRLLAEKLLEVANRVQSQGAAHGKGERADAGATAGAQRGTEELFR